MSTVRKRCQNPMPPALRFVSYLKQRATLEQRAHVTFRRDLFQCCLAHLYRVLAFLDLELLVREVQCHPALHAGTVIGGAKNLENSVSLKEDRMN